MDESMLVLDNGIASAKKTDKVPFWPRAKCPKEKTMFQNLTRMIQPSLNLPQRGASSRRPTRQPGGLRNLALVIMFTFALLPVSTWAKGTSEVNLQNPQVRMDSQPEEGTTESSPTAAQKYAAREANAKGLEKFEGGNGTIWIGGSTVVIVLLVVLIAVLI